MLFKQPTLVEEEAIRPTRNLVGHQRDHLTNINMVKSQIDQHKNRNKQSNNIHLHTNQSKKILCQLSVALFDIVPLHIFR